MKATVKKMWKTTVLVLPREAVVEGSEVEVTISAVIPEVLPEVVVDVPVIEPVTEAPVEVPVDGTINDTRPEVTTENPVVPPQGTEGSPVM